MGTVLICLCTRKQHASLTMRAIAVITLALAISYVKADGAHGHEHAHARDSGYGAPPEESYGAPAPSYGAPEPEYAPAPSYGEPVPYEEEGFDITPLIIAILVLVGLSLLFPTNVQVLNGNLNNVGGRKRRNAEEVARADFVGRTAEIYDHLNDVLEPVDRRCMEKLTCEVGALSYDAGITSHPFLKLVVPFVPGKYGKYMKHFIYSENCHKIKCSAYY